MEGPSIRNVMENGVEMFAACAAYIKQVYEPSKVEGVESLVTPEAEIDAVSDYRDGWLLYWTVFFQVTHKTG